MKIIKKTLSRLALTQFIPKLKHRGFLAPETVNWYNISCYQKLSEGFIREFEDRISFKYLSYNKNLTENIIRNYFSKFDINILLNNSLPQNIKSLLKVYQ
jgi:hypothetical protein